MNNINVFSFITIPYWFIILSFVSWLISMYCFITMSIFSPMNTGIGKMTERYKTSVTPPSYIQYIWIPMYSLMGLCYFLFIMQIVDQIRFISFVFLTMSNIFSPLWCFCWTTEHTKISLIPLSGMTMSLWLSYWTSYTLYLGYDDIFNNFDFFINVIDYFVYHTVIEIYLSWIIYLLQISFVIALKCYFFQSDSNAPYTETWVDKMGKVFIITSQTMTNFIWTVQHIEHYTDGSMGFNCLGLPFYIVSIFITYTIITNGRFLK